jgi:hypothetical protein
MRRLLCTGALAAVAAVALALAGATPVSATSAARTLAASLLARQVGHGGLWGPAPDRALVLSAWRDAGVDIRGLGTQMDLLHACTLLDTAAPRPAGPAPADYVLYRDSSGADRIGMFLSPVDLAVVDGGRIDVVPLPEITGAIGDATVERLLARPGSAHACRLSAARWPGGRDDTTITAGRIALADPGQVAEHIAWAAAHPRDADTGVAHTVTRILASFAAGVSGVVSQLAGALLGLVHSLLEKLGPVGAPFLALAGLLGHRFDGRRLHAVLTGVVLAALGLCLGLGWIIPFGWVLAGAVLAGAAASSLHVPVLGAIGGGLVGAAFAAASFLTSVLTGVDSSSNVCVGTVLFSLVADMLWLRPALAALGAAGGLHSGTLLGGAMQRIEQLPLLRHLAGDGHSMLDISGTAGDALALRPQAWLHTAHALAGDGAVAMATGADAMGAVGQRSLDLLSLAWRPASLSSDLLGHAADALRAVDAELRSGLPSLPRLREALLAMDPAQRHAVLSAIEHGSTHLVPQVQIAARLSHLHSGARTVTGIATGAPHNAPWWRLWRSPVRRRLLQGLPDVR